MRLSLRVEGALEVSARSESGGAVLTQQFYSGHLPGGASPESPGSMLASAEVTGCDGDRRRGHW